MKNVIRPTLLAAVIVAGVLLLQGCFPVVAAGVGAGALMVADRRPSETYLSDQAIEVRAMARINERFGDRVHANVTSYNLRALVTGEVFEAPLKEEVEKVVAAVPNVKAVINELHVAPTSGFSARSNDTYVTSKVKARFIEANRFSPNHVKVVTEAGTVYLMGLVTQREADAAAEIASTTEGVRKVVRVFEYIDEAEARRLDGRQPAPAGK